MNRRLSARFARALARLKACRGGVAATEFALCLPFLLGAGLMGLDVANRAIVQTQVAQLAAQMLLGEVPALSAPGRELVKEAP